MALVDTLLARTSKGAGGPAVLMLEDGAVFHGRACGAAGTAVGEVCFNTSLVGYLEILTDPSYAGQIVAMTYPQIGNYGVCPDDVQAPAAPGRPARPALRGMVVRDMCPAPSNWRSAASLPDYLREQGIVAIEGVDTRALVLHLREHGAQKGVVSTEVFDETGLRARMDAAPDLVGQNLVAAVSCPAPYKASSGDGARTHRVVAYDCGIKQGILDGLAAVGCEVAVVPWDAPAEDVLALGPDGVFLSNGPGDPDAVAATYEQVGKLLGKVPVFGICLGHQMVCLACGAEMEKLKFGHRGGNQPVMNLLTGRVEITAQNHGFGLVWPSLGPLVPELSGGAAEHMADGDLRAWTHRGDGVAPVAPVVQNPRFGRIRLTHVNLNDGTPEGIQLLDVPAFSVQYHPEASPGPTDARYLFTAFARLMDGEPSYLDIDIKQGRFFDAAAKEGSA